MVDEEQERIEKLKEEMDYHLRDAVSRIANVEKVIPSLHRHDYYISELYAVFGHTKRRQTISHATLKTLETEIEVVKLSLIVSLTAYYEQLQEVIKWKNELTGNAGSAKNFGFWSRLRIAVKILFGRQTQPKASTTTSTQTK